MLASVLSLKPLRRALACAALFAMPAAAHAASPCPDGYVCASNPQSVVKSLQAQGYKALVTKDEKAAATNGDSYIESAAAGYTYYIYFKDCTNHAECQSLEFVVTFEKDPAYSTVMTDDWNANKRFSAMYMLDDGGVGLSYDATTTGGLDQANFADVIDWWANGCVGHVKAFFDAHPAKDGKPWAPEPAAAATK